MGDIWKVEGRDAMKSIGVEVERVAKCQDPARRPGGYPECLRLGQEAGRTIRRSWSASGERVNGEKWTE